jgi:hypothetical protein
MNRKVSKYYKKLFAIRWIIGLARCDIEEVIRTKAFNPLIHWLKISGLKEFYADPFIYSSEDGIIDILYEEYLVREQYGKISLMKLDDNFNWISNNVLLDTKRHLSYPFIYKENGKSYVFPESANAGKLSCYEYDHAGGSLNFLKDVIHLPLLDSTVLKHNGKYWIFGIINVNDENFKLLIYYSDYLLGPYEAHHKNPVRQGLNGSRFAGNFITVDGTLYRPAQNCENSYGESIDIFRINLLNEFDFEEEPYMKIEMDSGDRNNRGMHSIHTINSLDNIIAVDGEKWIFAPHYRLFKFLKKKKLLKIKL